MEDDRRSLRSAESLGGLRPKVPPNHKEDHNNNPSVLDAAPEEEDSGGLMKFKDYYDGALSVIKTYLMPEEAMGNSSSVLKKSPTWNKELKSSTTSTDSEYIDLSYSDLGEIINPVILKNTTVDTRKSNSPSLNENFNVNSSGISSDDDVQLFGNDSASEFEKNRRSTSNRRVANIISRSSRLRSSSLGFTSDDDGIEADFMSTNISDGRPSDSGGYHYHSSRNSDTTILKKLHRRLVPKLTRAKSENSINVQNINMNDLRVEEC